MPVKFILIPKEPRHAGIQTTRLITVPSIYASIFADTSCKRRCLVSRPRHPICGVIMTFGIVYSGLSSRIGSSSCTSSAALAIRLFCKAAISACSSIRSRIDNSGGRLHHRQMHFVNQMSGFRGKRTMQRNIITFL